MSLLMERELASQLLDDGPIERELTWGKSFRVTRDETQLLPVTPKHSPTCIPFDLSIVTRRPRKKKKKKKLCNCSEKTRKETKSMPQLSLLERSVLSQDKYTELLSIPNKTVVEKAQSEKCFKKVKPRSCFRCFEPCPPRIIQMAVPNKRLVLENWKAYQNFLPAEILMRFDEILKSGGNLEPGEARHYFKQLKKKERKEVKKRKLLVKKKKEAKKRGDMRWLKKEIRKTVEAIASFLEEEPLITLNFQQMMTSNELLIYLSEHKVVKVKSRNCKCPFNRTVIEISDKFVKWMDSLSFFAEIQPVDSREVIEIPSMEELLEEEESEEEEEEEEEEAEEEEEEEEGEGEMTHSAFDRDVKGDLKGLSPSQEELGGEDGDVYGAGTNAEQFVAQKIVDKSELFLEEGEGSLNDMLQGFDDNTLEKLINILSMSPEGFLEELVDPSLFPGVTYGDVLLKLKEIRDGNLLEKQNKGNFLEDRMTEWAKTNDPNNVDDKVLDKIHETSTILSEFFKNSDLNDLKKKREGQAGDEDTIVEELFERTQQQTLKGAAPNRGDTAGDGLKTWQQGGEDGDMDGVYIDVGPEFEEEWLEDGEELYVGDIRPGYDQRRGEDEEGEEGEEGEEDEETRRKRQEEEARRKKEEEEEARRKQQEEAEKMAETVGSELDKLGTLMGIIRGHKPSVVYEHEPGTICCLSLKTWAAWLLEIANHAHNWTRWITDIIKQVRQFCAIIRGDVRGPDGTRQTLPKQEWRKFVKDTEEKVAAWKEYHKHVKDLSDDIIANFHGKPVTCCPKCLQDHLIKDVVTAHETLQALTEALNSAEYWHTCLDKMVDSTSKLTDLDVGEEAEATSLASEESYTIVIEEVPRPVESEESWEIEIEELQPELCVPSEYDFIEMLPVTINLQAHEIEELPPPEPPKVDLPPELPAKHKKGGKKEEKKPLKSNLKKR